MPPRRKDYFGNKRTARSIARYAKAKARARRRKPRVGRAPRGLVPSIYKYKRQDMFTIELSENNPSPPTNWTLFPTGDCIQKAWAFALTSVPGHTQFTSLYSQYKLTGVRLQMYPSCNSITAYRDLSNIIMWFKPARYGYHVDNLEELVSTQAIRKRVVFKDQKPLDIYMPLTQLAEVYGGVGITDYTTKKPGFISTQEVNTVHYGLDTVFQTVSSQPICSMPMSIKIIQTLYFQCKGVKASSAE